MGKSTRREGTSKGAKDRAEKIAQTKKSKREKQPVVMGHPSGTMDEAETSRESKNQKWEERADECSGNREFQRAPVSPERKISEQQKWIRTEQPGHGEEQAGCIIVLVFHRAHRGHQQYQD